MEVKNVVENLIKDIQDIENNINRFKNSSPIPIIEIDLVLSKLRDLYNDVIYLKELQPSLEEEEVTVDAAEEVIEDIPKETEPVEQDIPESKEEVIPEKEVNQDFELEAEAKSEPEIIDKQENPEPQENEATEIEDIEKKSAGIIADRLTSPKQFRNETLGQTRHGEDLSTKLQSQPLKDISTAIGINDRFQFIKELFEGNSKKFDETIKVLNDSPNFNEAFNYLSENFSWDMENPAVQSLLELTRRKHIINTDE